MSIEHLEPKSVFKFFSEISAIPRGSKNERAVTDYLLKFAEQRGLWAYRDEYLNVIIRKPASLGYENVPAVILQGHTDMVCEKNSHVEHDFTKDGIKLVADGEYLRAEGTTLGADNGMALAFCLALFDDNTAEHPPIEALFTPDEEAGMSGAANVDPQLLTGRRIINLDTGDEGKFVVSCAGGIIMHLYVPIEVLDVPDGYSPFIIRINGLKGGHSGTDIHKELGNANRILSRVLCALRECDFYLSDICGGAKVNAIPREAEATIWVKGSDCERASGLITKLEEDIKNEYRYTDPGVKLSLEKQEKHGDKATVFTKEVTRKLSLAGTLLPNGVQHMCKIEGFEDLVETSLNLGVVSLTDKGVDFSCLIRSSVVSRKYETEDRIRLVAEVLGANAEKGPDNPAWEFNPDSKLQCYFQDEYQKFTGEKPEMAATHGGLECGYFAEILNRPDMISFGPNMIDNHSPDERLEIASVARVWEFLKHALANMRE